MSETKTNFELVGDFHEIFGHPKPTVIDSNIFDSGSQLVNFRISLIEEELNELKDGIKKKDIVEVTDALSDILYVVYGMGQALGINLDKSFGLVHESNMTKLCKNEDEAKETIEHYKTLDGFQNTDVRYRLSPDNTNYTIYNASNGKILKSKYFKLPCFDSVVGINSTAKQ